MDIDIMTEAQYGFLQARGLLCNPDVVDCDPVGRTVKFVDGSIRRACEIYTRVMGYHRPVECWNPGKKQEHLDRTYFLENSANVSNAMRALG